jgi:hypothetical protein
MAAMVNSHGQLNRQLASQLWSRLRSQLWSQLWSQLDSQLGDQLWSQLRDQLDRQLASQLWSQLRSQLGSQLDSQLDSQLKEINSHWYLSLWWLVWAGWYDYARYIGVKFDEDKYNLFTDFVTNIGFCIPYKGIVFISDNPTAIHWQEGRLHNAEGKSVEYADGWGIYTWRGVPVTEKLILHPEEITREDIAGEENAEVRRAMQEKLEGRFYALLDAREVARQTLGAKGYEREYTLFRTREPDSAADEHIQYVRCICHSTGREYMLCVPPDITSPLAAVAWTFDKEEDAYRPMVEA